MNVLLNEKDYDYLYPYLSPKEITQEFSQHSLGERAIQKLYKSWGYPSAQRKLEELFRDAYGYADVDVDETTWGSHWWQAIQLERDYRIQVVWSRLRALQEVYS
jgi:hypothetical protein